MTSRALAAARTAPIRPPISAWDELEGMPKYQVMRFQETAPISAASTTSWDTTPVSTMPLPSVAATSVEMSAPTTFATAAIPRATPGRRARVEMDVAMAFAESWNPLVKSKRRAVATTTRSRLPVKRVSGGFQARGRWHKAVTSATPDPGAVLR